jgi:hypothetical protein
MILETKLNLTFLPKNYLWQHSLEKEDHTVKKEILFLFPFYKKPHIESIEIYCNWRK